MIIREATRVDADQLAQMIQALCLEIEALGGHEISRDSDVWNGLPKVVNEWLEAPDQYIAVSEEPGGLLTGFGHCRCYERGGALKPRKFLHIGSFYVVPDHRKQGTGGSLLNTMLSWAREQNCEACELNVRVNNPAIQFYKRKGFEDFQTQMKLELS